jgi:hypothetical protein
LNANISDGPTTALRQSDHAGEPFVRFSTLLLGNASWLAALHNTLSVKDPKTIIMASFSTDAA